MKEDYFSKRSSIRSFKKEKIDESLIESIIERAMRAPTCGNMQLYTVISTRNEEMKKEMAAFHFNQPAAVNCDVILTICADFHRFSEWCRINHADAGYDNFHSFVTALTDAVIFAQQITTIAEMEGLGTCYLGTVNYNAKQISELLDLPELTVPVAALAIGYPDGEGEKVERLPLEAVYHKEKYRHDSDAEISGLFKVKDEFETNKKFVAENGKGNLAQVFTDIRYPKSMNEAVSESFMQLLKDVGFV